jgi:hypothetical protein
MFDLFSQLDVKECTAALNAKCESCGELVHPIFLDNGEIVAGCCETPQFPDECREHGFTIREMDNAMQDAFKANAKTRVKFKGLNPIASSYDPKGQEAMIVAMTLVDPETSELKWEYTNKEHIAEIGKKSGKAISALSAAGLYISGLSAGAKEDAEKKSDQEEASTTGSE